MSILSILCIDIFLIRCYFQLKILVLAFLDVLHWARVLPGHPLLELGRGSSMCQWGAHLDGHAQGSPSFPGLWRPDSPHLDCPPPTPPQPLQTFEFANL